MQMRTIDLDHWPRRPQYEFFRPMDWPFFNLTFTVEVTALRAAAKAARLPITPTIAGAILRAANAVPEFRQRLRGDTVVEHARIDGSCTVLGRGDRLGFCLLDAAAAPTAFIRESERRFAAARETPSLDMPPARDDLIFMTVIPWISFTALQHPIDRRQPDSVPRCAWGRFMEVDGRCQMPLSVQAHHALIDGVHVGRFAQRLEQLGRDAAWLAATEPLAGGAAGGGR